MPSARYSCGLTVLPDCPTWRALGIQPASTIGRDTLSVAPSRCGELLEAGDVVLLRDAAADREQEVGLGDVDVAGRHLAEAGVLGARRAVDSPPARRARTGAAAPAPRAPAANAPARTISSVHSLPGNRARRRACRRRRRARATGRHPSRARRRRWRSPGRRARRDRRREAHRVDRVPDQHERRLLAPRSAPVSARAATCASKCAVGGGDGQHLVDALGGERRARASRRRRRSTRPRAARRQPP